MPIINPMEKLNREVGRILSRKLGYNPAERGLSLKKQAGIRLEIEKLARDFQIRSRAVARISTKGCVTTYGSRETMEALASSCTSHEGSSQCLDKAEIKGVIDYQDLIQRTTPHRGHSYQRTRNVTRTNFYPKLAPLVHSPYQFLKVSTVCHKRNSSLQSPHKFPILTEKKEERWTFNLLRITEPKPRPALPSLSDYFRTEEASRKVHIMQLKKMVNDLSYIKGRVSRSRVGVEYGSVCKDKSETQKIAPSTLFYNKLYEVAGKLRLVRKKRQQEIANELRSFRLIDAKSLSQTKEAADRSSMLKSILKNKSEYGEGMWKDAAKETSKHSRKKVTFVDGLSECEKDL